MDPARRRGRHHPVDRGRRRVRARRGQFLPRARREPAALGVRVPAGARRPLVPGAGRFAGAAPEEPACADGASQRPFLRGREERQRARVVVRRRHGFDALLSPRRGRAPLPSHLPRCAGAVRRRRLPALQEVVRRVLLHQAPRRAARHRRDILRRPGPPRFCRGLRADEERGRALPAGVRADRRAPG